MRLFYIGLFICFLGLIGCTKQSNKNENVFKHQIDAVNKAKTVESSVLDAHKKRMETQEIDP